MTNENERVGFPLNLNLPKHEFSDSVKKQIEEIRDRAYAAVDAEFSKGGVEVISQCGECGWDKIDRDGVKSIRLPLEYQNSLWHCRPCLEWLNFTQVTSEDDKETL